MAWAIVTEVLTDESFLTFFEWPDHPLSTVMTMRAPLLIAPSQKASHETEGLVFCFFVECLLHVTLTALRRL